MAQYTQAWANNLQRQQQQAHQPQAPVAVNPMMNAYMAALQQQHQQQHMGSPLQSHHMSPMGVKNEHGVLSWKFFHDFPEPE